MRGALLPLAAALAALLLSPTPARAQVDALIDAVVGAVEPTPVYDEGLREATEHLASKIDRLNHVLFGGSEATSASYRYMTMYSDLYDLTTAFTSYVDRTYAAAARLERLYRELDAQSSVGDYATAIETTWHSYDNAVRQGGAIVARFKTLFSDPHVTNAEVRSASREAVERLEQATRESERALWREIAVAEMAAGLVECSSIMEIAPQDYVTEGRRTYGTDISSGGTGSSMGTLATAVMVVIGLLAVVYTLFAGIHIMRGSPGAEAILGRLLLFIVIAIVLLLSIQGSI